MFFDANELTPKKIQVSPRVCHGGELAAIWIEAYGKSAATHLWDIAVARAFCNREEIEAAIASEMERLKCDRLTAAKTLVLRSGLFELKQKPDPEKEAIELSSDTAYHLRAIADKEGLTVDDYLQKIIKNG